MTEDIKWHTKIITTCFSIIIGLTANTIKAQNFEWVKAFGGNSADYGYSISVDTVGNVYTTGYFKDSADFDPGASNAYLSSVGDGDIFVQKMDASGNLLWAKAFGGASLDYGSSINVDASGNVYTTGYFEATVDFDPGVGTAYLTSAGYWDIFIQKMDASGNFIWAKSLGGTSYDNGLSIDFDAAGNVYTTGPFWGTGDFDPGVGTTNLSSEGLSDIFVQKMDAFGNFLWAKAFGGNADEVGFSICIDALDNVYITGYFSGTVDFDPGGGTTNLTSEGNRDIFVQKMDASGNFLWAKSFGGTNSDYGRSVSVDASGNVYTTGYFEVTVDFDPGVGTFNLTSAGNRDIFVQKMDAAGNFLWAKSFGGTAEDGGISIFIDVLGNIYTTGYFEAIADFDPGVGTANLIASGIHDIFIQKMDASGNFLWAKSIGGSSDDIGFSISVDESGNIFTTGLFSETTDFDPNAGTTNLSSAGQSDIFVQKMNQSLMNITDFVSGIKITAFPNPSNGLLQISFEKPMSDVEITINDVEGKVVYMKKLDGFSSEQINIEGTSGIYLLMVKTAKEQCVVKLVKE